MFGKNLTALRKANGLTQEQVAKYLGIACTVYVCYESGTLIMPLQQMQDVADLSGCSLSALLCDDNSKGQTNLPFVFKAEYLTTDDLKELAHFKKIGMSYIKMSHLLENTQPTIV